jgi:DNA-binding Xre family transcriptional regulator
MCYQEIIGNFVMEGSTVTISCRLRLLLARVNVERAIQGDPPLSLRRLSEESGVSLSVLAALHKGRSQRIDYNTIDHLLEYFNRYFHVTTGDLLAWEQASEDDSPYALSQEVS